MRHLARFGLLSALVTMITVPARLAAQAVSSDSNAAATTVRDTASATAPVATPVATAAPAQPVSGAPLTGLRAGVHARTTARPDAPTAAAPSHANLGASEALMIVGVAGLIVGAIIGGTPGTIIMVAGGLLGLKGLYDYLQ
jgi:hypothetical protein